MSQTAATEIHMTAPELAAIGARAAMPISGGFADYEAVDQTLSGTTQDVILKKSPEAERKEKALEGNLKAPQKLAAFEMMSPAAPKARQNGAAIQKQGMQVQQRMIPSFFGRRPQNAYSMLKARTPVAAPTKKVEAPQAKPSLPKTMTFKVTALQVGPKSSSPQSRNLAKLKLVGNDDAVPAMKPKQPSLTQRMNYWGTGMACNLG